MPEDHQHGAHDHGDGALRQARGVGDAREDRLVGKQRRVGLAHNAQVDGPQADLGEDSREDGRNLEDRGQKAGHGAGYGAGEHAHEDGDHRVYA